MARILRYVSWIVRSLFVRLQEEDGVYKASYGKRIWYIPFAKYYMALWAFDFMDTHERYEEVLKEGDVIIEIGACTGEYTIAAAERIGASGRIYAFEIEPLSFKCLVKNVQLSGSSAAITPINLAVSDKDYETLEFGHSPNTIAGGSFHHGKEKFLVRTITLDTYFGNNQDVDRIAMLKLTVNGHEPEIVLGANELLKRTRHIAFQSARHREVVDILQKHGFHVKAARSLRKGVKAVLMENPDH